MTSFLGMIFQLGIYSLIFSGCSSPKTFKSRKVLPTISSFPATLKTVRSAERSLGSKDISYKYTVGIDTSLYPNRPNFRLPKVKRYLRPSLNDGMEYTIEYFATTDDSVRTILHEWNVAKGPNAELNYADSENLDSTQLIIIKSFASKFMSLDSTFTVLLGEPIIRDIKSNFLEETERDDVKWVGNQLSAYLLMFKRDIDTYRQIRLIVYPR